MPKLAPPAMPPEGATAEEVGKALADLLDWCVRQKTPEMINAGVPTDTLFLMRQVAHSYRNGNVNAQTYKRLAVIADALDILDFG